MGVRINFRKGAWWIDINHHNKRKSKRIGKDRKAAKHAAKAIEERLAFRDLELPSAPSAETFQTYAETWLAAVASSLKASTLRFYRDNLNNLTCTHCSGQRRWCVWCATTLNGYWMC